MENENEKSKEELEREQWLMEKSEFICTSKWCKGAYIDHRYIWYENDVKICPKCRSFAGELSGGVAFEKNEYSGDRHDGKAHEVDFKFSDYSKGKWGKFWGK